MDNHAQKCGQLKDGTILPHIDRKAVKFNKHTHRSLNMTTQAYKEIEEIHDQIDSIRANPKFTYINSKNGALELKPNGENKIKNLREKIIHLEQFIQEQ